MRTLNKQILNRVLDVTRFALQPFPSLTKEQKKRIIKKSKAFEDYPNTLWRYHSELLAFKYLITEEHPIFDSPRFISPSIYHPFQLESYNDFHKIPSTSKESDVHGNNYLYTKTNLRNGILFTYYDLETNSYIPVTFNTNFPICLIAPDPFCVNGDIVKIIERMLRHFYFLSKGGNLKSFPLVFKGLDDNIANLLVENVPSTKVEYDKDITTIPAEMNFPALSYKISSLKKMVSSGKYKSNINKKRPKLIPTVKKLEAVTYCEEWDFDTLKTKKLTHAWASSKINRLKHKGITNVDSKYIINTVIESIGEQPPGLRNKNFFTIAVKSSKHLGEVSQNQLLGVVIASRNNNTVAALNAVVVPVEKNFRDLGCFAIYKLAEKMSQHGITSYWHGPKESISDITAVKEFMGEPYKIEKKYCVRCKIVRPNKMAFQEHSSKKLSLPIQATN